MGDHALAPHEHRDKHRTQKRRQPHRRGGQRHRGRVRGSQQKAAEAQRGLHERRVVEHRARIVVAVALHQNCVGDPQHGEKARKYDVEAAPSPAAGERTADKRPDIGREPHSDTADAHSRARALPRKTRHSHRLHERQCNARGDGLQHPSRNKHGEDRSEETGHGTRQVEAQRQVHQALQREPARKVSDHRHRDPHREHVDGRDPLPLRRIDGEVVAHFREHGVHHRLGERAQSAGDDNDGEQGVGVPLLGKMHGNLRTFSMTGRSRFRSGTRNLARGYKTNGGTHRAPPPL